MAYSFRGLVHYHHGRKHGSLQADMVLVEPRGLHFDLQTARSLLQLRLSLGVLKFCLYSNKLPSTKPHLFDSVTTCGPCIQVHESMGAMSIQTTTGMLTNFHSLYLKIINESYIYEYEI